MKTKKVIIISLIAVIVGVTSLYAKNKRSDNTNQCVYWLSNGYQCSNYAQQGSVYCWKHEGNPRW